MIPIIGLTGEPGKQAGVGKDTVADFMTVCGDYKPIALAQPIKDGVCAMFNLPSTVFDNRDAKECPIHGIGVSPRYLAQTLGTEWGRKLVRDDLWFRLADRRIAALRDRGYTPVVTDVRFPNEADWICRQGGSVVRVERPNIEPVAGHASEDGVDEHQVDYRLHNAGHDLDHLRRAVIDLVAAIERDYAPRRA